ncbi:hypothetical protein [Archangium violaceum]|uniref:hypothetical protein n=1 Tax=Archangium violaceum TaxID=83451 RepID=UPI00126A03EB|nr:hypothetical protein [Archangium violaceum]
MKKPIPLWLIGLGVWIVTLGVVSARWLDLSIRQELSGPINWPGLALIAMGPAGLVMMIVQRIRAEPTPEERAAFWAIFHAEPGTIGAVVVTRKGVPEVIATVRSTEEYLKLAGSGQLPADHRVYLPDDIL